MTATGSCQKCHSDIPVEAQKCAQCGYDPVEIGSTARTAYAGVGVLLCLTIVGGVIGLPLILLAAYANHKAKDRTAADYSPP